MRSQGLQALACLSMAGMTCAALVVSRDSARLVCAPHAVCKEQLPTSSLPITTIYSSSVPVIQSTTAAAPPATEGTVHTNLETAGRNSAMPFTSTVIAAITASIKVPFDSSIAVSSARPTAALSDNIFAAPIATDAPPAQIQPRDNHPARKTGIVSKGQPLHTNKFYANMFLGNQDYATFTHPYSLTWSKGGGVTGSWGMSVSHVEQKQLTFGPGNPAKYFINPIGIQSVVLSASELGPGAVLRTDNHQAFSVNAILARAANAPALISFPLVQGMAFVTGIYNGATPLLQSGVQFRKLTFAGKVSKKATYKYRMLLEDDSVWLLYITPNGAAGPPPLTLVNSRSIQGPQNFHGTIQIAKNPMGASGEQQYDLGSGSYPIGATMSAGVINRIATYGLYWTKGGLTNQPLLMFALPHQVESLHPESQKHLSKLQLRTTTKGMATALSAEQMLMIEPDLPVDIGFEPVPHMPGKRNFVSNAAVGAINGAAVRELSEDIDAQSNLDSMYYSGKALSKFATIVFATQTYGGNSSLAIAGLNKLKRSFSRFVNNQQKYPLVYDTTWKGAVSSGSYVTGDSGIDFGNSFYNDHHFHYGYFVHAASVIASLDPNWLKQGTNKAWVNMLVRDFANPIGTDAYFPFSRSFDWYHGHSWAKGLFDSPDGKDQESTSEDAFAAYAVKLWGRVIGDLNMEARANLQLAVLARSLRNYFLLESSNKNQPSQFLGNRVTGILFENKVDHTTYFGSRDELIQGIHMIPVSPISAYMRSKTFVKSEWQQYFANGYCNSLKDGWRGILMANYALIDPKGSYKFFSDKSFDYSWLDGGASRTWYLAYAAGLGGAP